MPEWLKESFDEGTGVSTGLLVTRLLAALALGCVTAGIYRFTRPRAPCHPMSFIATLVLLTVLIAMVTLVIGNSVARAFSLVGALSIVRFRTKVEDTRDTAFVILAVAAGMAAGAGFLPVALIGLPVAAVAAILFRSRVGIVVTPLDFALTVRLGLSLDSDGSLRPTLERHLERWRLLETATSRQGSAYKLTYEARLRSNDAAIPLVTELNRIEGVQGVELLPLSGPVPASAE